MKTFSFQPKHIPFLKIDAPPNIYDLKRAEESARKNKRHNKQETLIRWEVEEVERKKLMDSFSSFETVYIDFGDFEKESKDKYANNLIGISYPALSELGRNKEKLKKDYWYAPQFAFGGYYQKDKLFLIDDIFEWSHHRISWSKIRTAESIIESLKTS